MLERIVGTIIVFTGGDFGGGSDTDIAIMPGFEETSGTFGVDDGWLRHWPAGPGFWEAVDEAVFVGIGAEPLPFGMVAVGAGIERVAIGIVDKIAGEAGVMIGTASGNTETAARGASRAKTRASGDFVARIIAFVSV